MEPRRPQRKASLAFVVVTATFASMAVAAEPFERTAERKPCAHHDPSRKPLFGDLRATHERVFEEADEPFYSPLLQERAWTSPIWYRP